MIQYLNNFMSKQYSSSHCFCVRTFKEISYFIIFLILFLHVNTPFSFVKAAQASSLPTVNTDFPIDIVDHLVLSGEVAYDGGTSIVERGMIYSSSTATPTIGEIGVSKILAVLGSGSGKFSVDAYLDYGETYYFRAYAINSEGIGYGNIMSHYRVGAPLVAISEAESVTLNSAVLRGEVLAENGAPVVDRGIKFAKNPTNPFIPDETWVKISIGNGIGSFSQNVTGLDEDTVYYFCAYADNAIAISWICSKFKTKKNFPWSLFLPTIILTNQKGS